MKLLNISSLNRDSSGIHNPNSLFTSSGLGINTTVNSTSGTINNLDTTDISSIKFTSATSLSGLAGGGDGKIFILINGNSTSLNILHNSANSDVGNKIYSNTESDVELMPNSSLLLQYDNNSSIWRIISNSDNDHNDLLNINGGDPLIGFYHSNQAINTTDSPSFAGLTVTGDLNVTGTTTTINSVTLEVKDKNIELGKVETPSDTTADGGGITLKGDTDKTLNWVNTTDSWTSSENIDLASGKVYKINNITVISDSQVLGKSLPTGDIVGTSDTQSLSNKTLDGFTLNGDITITGYASDIDLIDNNASALSFDSAGKSGILEIDTTDSLEKVKMSGGLEVTGTSTLGDVTASGSISLNSLIFPSTDGTNGQAIITDGNGNLAFGDVASGGGGGAGLTYQITSTPPVSLKLGMPVYWNGTNYAPANANTNTKIPTAIVKELNVGDYTVQYGGILTLTNTQWNEITGGSGGLSNSSGTNIYYLSDVEDGQITNISPIFSIPVLNCIKNDGTNSTVEIKFGTLSSTLLTESYSRERETFTGNGSNLTFTLTLTPYSRNTTMVTIDGVVQQSNAFSISDKDIVFSESPPANSEIEVNYVVQKNLNYANITKHTETTSTSKASFTLPVTPNSESEVMAWVGGSYQDNSNFTLNGNVLTFDTNVDSGVKVQFVIFTSIQFADFPFIKRKSITIDNNSTKTLIDVFGNQASGRYDFHVMSNPLIGGTVRLQESDPINVRVETFSTDISSTASTSSKLNIYINGSGNLEFQNLLGSSISLMLERHQ